MKYFYLFILFSFSLESSLAQLLNPEPNYTSPYQQFFSSYYEFQSNYSWYKPYASSPQDEYNKIFKEKLALAEKKGEVKKINSSTELNSIVPPVLNILDTVPNVGAAPKQECEKTEVPPQREQIDIKPLKPKTITYITFDENFNKRCDNFITQKGEIGEWGKYIEDYVKTNKDIFLNTELPGMINFPSTCPNWKRLDDDGKTHFWVWMFASIAQVESSCKPDAVNLGIVPDPSDKPRGLLQLNTLKKNRYWRGENCKFPGDIPSVTNPKNNIMCGLDIMKEILRGDKGVYRTGGQIFPTNSYWEKLRPNHSSTGGPIGKLARKFKPCGAVP